MNPTRRLGCLEGTDPFDVCIIGSGFAGTVLAVSLAERGVRTLLLESGGGLARWLFDRRLRGLAAYTVSGDTAYPTRRTKARALGGNSNFWTGRCERLHPSDLETHPYTPTGSPWPIRYEDLDPFYERAEETLRVRGDGLSLYVPPRRRALPLRGSNISALQALIAKAGVTVDCSPTATPQRGLRFFRVQRELLPRVRSAAEAVIVSGATVTKLITGSTRSVVGAEVRTVDGDCKTARARFYVVACGGIESARLLLLSTCEAFPRGIGNAYDRVGRGFTEHPGVNIYSKIRHNRGTFIPRHKVGRCHQFYDHLRSEGLGSVLPVFIQSWVFPHHLVSPRLSDVPRTFMALLGRVIRPTLYIGATTEMLPRDENRVTLSRDVHDEFGSPLAHLHFSYAEQDRATLKRTHDLIMGVFARVGAEDVRQGPLTWSRHHIGTCRMGTNPQTSVVDSDLRVHDCPNLFVCGSETFVTGGAVPPVLTIVALAHRLADYLSLRLRQGDP